MLLWSRVLNTLSEGLHERRTYVNDYIYLLWGQESLYALVTRLSLKKCGWSVGDVDLFELNEAFAAQSMCVVETLGIDRSKVNVQGNKTYSGWSSSYCTRKVKMG